MDLRESLEKQNEIVLSLFKHVIATTAAGKPSNLLFSPALLNVILSIIAAKSPGDIEKKILSLLQASSTDELNTVSSKIVTTVLADNTSSGGPTIAAANGVWAEKSEPVETSLKDIIENSYKATFNLVDFRNKADEVVEEVNSWVEKETKGLIKNLIPKNSVSPATDIIFANALFFNGRWDQEFNPSLTKDSDFHRLDGTTVRVPFMSGYSMRYDLVAYQGFKVLTLPYRGGRGDYGRRFFSMQIYLPDEKDGLPAMVERLASCRGFLSGHGDIPGNSASIGELKVPRFKFEFGFTASDALEGLGLELPGDTIIHKSCIEVDEVGSKAAAAAAVISIGGCFRPPKEKYDFVADHPFLFLVKEHMSGLVLFLGQVTDPSMH
ncbi:hypothetical protein Bca4012_035626 [Brassica carinata]|uniref:Serpin domain-containing protein n=1 Tax=Brassica carinata TaxID=52824 RepID=A0A8X7WC90_BRACI|nr:hypothetical protein Bca52824_009415 [Brassica carinata]